MRAPRRLSHAAVGALVALPVGALAVTVPATAAAADPSVPSTTGQAPSAAAQCGDLAVGSSGAAVKTIQRAIGAGTDGDFGPQTESTLEHWQRRQHIPASGVVDAATWNALPQSVSWRACGQAVTAVPPQGQRKHCAKLVDGDVGPAVAVLQGAVGAAVDSGFGPHTLAAVKAAQRQHHLRATGIVGFHTWKALGLTSTPACEIGPAATGTPAPPAGPPDERKQQRIRRRVARIVAGLTGPAATSNRVAETALQFAHGQFGKPYQYGAAGPRSYDCSGLVMASYDAAALPLPRVAADQYAAGPHVPLADVQQGDLLFWASDVAKPGTVYHTAIYVGNGQILDAPHTGTDVQVQDLWSEDLLPTAVRPAAELRLPAKPGDTGATVSAIQTALTHHGYEISVDGGYGSQTTAAVRAWQAKRHLRTTGRVNVATFLSLGWTPGK